MHEQDRDTVLGTGEEGVDGQTGGADAAGVDARESGDGGHDELLSGRRTQVLRRALVRAEVPLATGEVAEMAREPLTPGRKPCFGAPDNVTACEGTYMNGGFRIVVPCLMRLMRTALESA